MLPIPSHIYAGEPLVFQDQSLAPLTFSQPLNSVPFSSETGPVVNPSVQVPLELMPFSPPEFSFLRPDLFAASAANVPGSAASLFAGNSSVPGGSGVKHDLVWHFGLS